jgi:hypothetical protein
MNYVEIHHALQARMRWEKARLLQNGDLPNPTEIYNWCLKLEVLRRIECAQEAGDRRSARVADSSAGREAAFPPTPLEAPI